MANSHRLLALLSLASLRCLVAVNSRKVFPWFQGSNDSGVTTTSSADVALEEAEEGAAVDPMSLASSASIDREGFFAVSQLKNREAMALYTERVIDELGGYVDSPEQRLNIMGMAPFYVGAGSPSRYDQLVAELRSKTWALSASGQMRAYVHKMASKQCNNTDAEPLTQAMEEPLDEIGYECLAVLSSEVAMSRFITRVIYAYGGSVSPGDLARIEGMSRWFSGENGVQSFDALLEDLRHKEWGLCSESCDVEKVSWTPYNNRGIAPVAQAEATRDSEEASTALPVSVLDPSKIDTDARFLCLGAGPMGPLMRWWESQASDDWEHTSNMLSVWRREFPDAPVIYDDGTASCVLREQGMRNSSNDTNSSNEMPKRVFSLVSSSGPLHCNATPPSLMKPVTPEIFVSETTGEARHWIAAWPSKGVCTSKHKCPLVMMLHGAAEHGGPGVGEGSLMALATLPLFRYAFQDTPCKDLRSVLVFPQLLKKERWEWKAVSLYDEFVIPLLRHVMGQRPHTVDHDRVALVGYSEGAVGAIHGALRHPGIFSLVMPVALTWGEWWELPWLNKQLLAGIPEQPVDHPFRLKTIVMPLPELQSTKFYGRSSRTLSAMLHVLSKFGLADKVSIHSRWYAGLDHMTILDAVFGRWTDSYRTLWLGKW